MAKREYKEVGEPRAPYGLTAVTATRRVGSKGKGANGETATEKPFVYDTFGNAVEGNAGASPIAWAQFVAKVLAEADHSIAVTGHDGASRTITLAEMYDGWVYGEDMAARQEDTNKEVDTWVPAGPKHDMDLVTGQVRVRDGKALVAGTTVPMAKRLAGINQAYEDYTLAKSLDPDTKAYVPKSIKEAVARMLMAGTIVGDEAGGFKEAPAQEPPTAPSAPEPPTPPAGGRNRK